MPILGASPYGPSGGLSAALGRTLLPQQDPTDIFHSVLERRRLGADTPGPVEAARLPFGTGVQPYVNQPSTAPVGQQDVQSQAVANPLFGQEPRLSSGTAATTGSPPPAVLSSQVAPVGPTVKPVAPAPGVTAAPAGQTFGAPSAGGGAAPAGLSTTGPSQTVGNMLSGPNPNYGTVQLGSGVGGSTPSSGSPSPEAVAASIDRAFSGPASSAQDFAKGGGYASSKSRDLFGRGDLFGGGGPSSSDQTSSGDDVGVGGDVSGGGGGGPDY